MPFIVISDSSQLSEQNDSKILISAKGASHNFTGIVTPRMY